MEKISEIVWLYIKRRPFLKEMIKSNVVNYSKLARKLADEIFKDKSKFYAVKASLMRISVKLRKKEDEIETKVLKILKNTKIKIRNKIGVIISRNEINNIKAISAVKSEDFYTYIADINEIEKFEYFRSVIRIEKNLNLIILSSSEEIENTPGVISTLLHLLAAEGINVKEFISSYTETMLVISESDTSRAFEILSTLTK